MDERPALFMNYIIFNTFVPEEHLSRRKKIQLIAGIESSITSFFLHSGFDVDMKTQCRS